MTSTDVYPFPCTQRNITREREGDLDKDPKKDLQLRELAAKERMFKVRTSDGRLIKAYLPV